jgi:antimicrobial peptide system SdpA family protein
LERKLYTQFFLPEGWAFFTRNPREDRYIVYRLATGGSWIDTNLGPHNRPRNAFGLNRKSRAQGVEIGLLLVSIHDDEWLACRKSPAICLATTPVSKDFKDISPIPTLCGEIGVVMQPPVPWAWSSLPRPVTMPSKVVRVRVHC